MYTANNGNGSDQWHGTTILSIRKGDQVVIAVDGQVTLGNTVIKATARKVRPLGAPARRFHRGVVTYQDLEGGFYGLVDEHGETYNPLNLPEEYQQDGLTVYFSFVPRTGVMSIRMWGTPVDLLYIGPRD